MLPCDEHTAAAAAAGRPVQMRAAAVRVDPGSVVALAATGERLLRLGRWWQAERRLRAALAVGGDERFQHRHAVAAMVQDDGEESQWRATHRARTLLRSLLASRQ